MVGFFYFAKEISLIHTYLHFEDTRCIHTVIALERRTEASTETAAVGLSNGKQSPTSS